MVGQVKVSICIVTYNQEQYIAECLQSVVDQVADFSFEVVVSDDASSDRTPEIIRDFSLKYPGLFKVFLHEKNLGAGDNFVFAHQQARGEYIAHLDGDDYCLPGKLQAQADYLDQNPRCNIVWHKMLVELPDGSLLGHSQVPDSMRGAAGYVYDMEFDRGAIIQFIAVGANSSKMYRKNVREYEVADFDTLDYFANVEQVGDGVGCFACDSPLGVYRAGVGVSSGSSKTRLLLCKTFLYFASKYPQYRSQVNTAALTYLLVDLKNCRGTWWDFFKVYLRTFHPLSVVRFYRGMNVIRQLRLGK
ncbi:glycosyltransferase family 2 protein [Pseudomonas entomophila]|uniref:glycosyltransferase family 2 protein n=1 Tax=Pseudomonas entomophila TaxID=312306 RepID=UPI00200C5A10|nr:glycosyltransferase family 2 protein [Pseudomonas entomophila]